MPVHKKTGTMLSPEQYRSQQLDHLGLVAGMIDELGIATRIDQLICERQAGIPMMMQSLDGNSSDKTSFHDTVNSHIEQLHSDFHVEYIVADSALYSADTLKDMQDFLWLSRVPETLKLAREVIHSVASELMKEPSQTTYRSLCVTYGGIKQRWVVVFSPEAYRRGQKSVNRQLSQKSTTEPDEEVIAAYKDQQKVERGFRFLKDPMFMASTLFLKSPKRIMALMMVMTLSLLVYAALEYRIREALKANNATFPNQKGEAINNPTARWVFQYFTGIHLLTIAQIQKVILNLNEHHLLLLSLLGKRYEQLYSGDG